MIVVVAVIVAWWLVKSGTLRTMQGAGAILFGVYVDASFNVYSSLTSSPWTFENFSRDPERAKSCRKYVMMANLAAFALGLFGTIVAASLWPLAGAGVVAVSMWTVYHKAIGKGEEQGGDPDNGWGDKPAAAPQAVFG